MAHHGRPDEEMFLRQNSDQPVPAVGPLRINKAGAASGTPPPRTSASPAAVMHPASRPPTGPLPYPDDRPRPTGTPEGRLRGDSVTDPFNSSPRAKFTANDPNRPTVAGYAHPPLSAGRNASPANSHNSSERDSADGLFQRPLNRVPTEPPTAEAGSNPYPEYHQQYWPPPANGAGSDEHQDNLNVPGNANSGLSRFDSVASVMTTRATRGSPPPPETPIAQPSNDIESRFAAAGFAKPGGAVAPSNAAGSAGPGNTAAVMGPAALSAAANQRAAQYSGVQQRRQETPPVAQPVAQPVQESTRPWTPPRTGSGAGRPGNAPVYSPPPGTSITDVPPVQHAEHALEHDFRGMNVNDEPPPAYDSVASPAPGNRYPNEKGRPANVVVAQPTPTAAQQPHNQGHPAFDPRTQTGQTPSPAPYAGSVAGSASGHYAGSSKGTPQPINASPAPSALPVSPPPLPEGWIAHLDPGSGQYYYIHLASQATQWEFPKGPNPLDPPLSPTGTFVGSMASPITGSFNMGSSKLPLASPGFPVPQTATFRPDGYLSMASIASPTAVGFTGPPPTAGVEIFKVAPSNGVYFGPYLRYTNMDIERGYWLGSIMLITDIASPPTIHLHQSVDLSPNPRQLKANPIHSHQRWMFYRYDIEIKMEDQGAKWTYAITSHLGCTRYEFLVAGQHETSWRFIAHSGNDFAVNVNANERSKLGGVGFMWKDILQKHIECNGFHCQIGLGDQIFGDRMWREIPTLREWTGMSGKENRKNAPWTPKHEEDVTHAYFHYYTSHFDQPHLREAWAQIPHILTLDHHDIFDGFGSYPDFMQQSNIFKNIGRIGVDMYLLFQHHTTVDLLRNVHDDTDLFTITGAGWHFIKYLGPAVTVVGPDTRSERTLHQVMAGPTYQGLFPKIALLPPSVQHCVWLLPVPVIYPRLESMEHITNTVASGKKMATGTFNMVGKVTSSLAGVVGAKGAVGDGFNAVKKAVGKSGLMSGILSPFGGIDMLDELRDQWTHESKDLERTYLIRTLQGIAHNKSLRMTFLSGNVNSCGAGLLHDPSHPQDHKTMYQIITAPVVNAPPSGYVLRLLHNNKPLYVPANGHRSTNQPSDTKEDMMEIFSQDVTGNPRELKRLMARRNYVACVAFDPELVQGAFGAPPTPGGGQQGRLSLAVDFMVQGDGVYAGAVKYGPVIVPSVEYGR
ncbi:hypothetical protein BT63DRAFT_219465 [Microthyrium microscopicum]|uniref:WW domain-containing protein n=1 Tax=Microthyrium microscopicum TaxID=703497 RepID=A0A6A6UIZ1_9PEZI|nr:hypothetical protein BT63DRAFT_219465 [Microthyrium microscopicum]